MKTNYNLSRLYKKLIFLIFKNFPFINGYTRAIIYKKFNLFKIGNDCFIGQDVLIDDFNLSALSIGDKVMITSGTKILTHFYDVKKSQTDGTHRFKVGEIVICDNVFIGMNSLIIKPVVLGKGVIIPAGSVVVQDIFSCESTKSERS